MNDDPGSTTVLNSSLIGQTLDDKYRIERQLGKGGMGTVYLATHLGTERPVALKVIAPQFMERPEFVERFRREARAAGRLRHPNVVDVTDFGICNSCTGRVAYLVMEYLDGCTLGEILDEEKNLPVSWTLDILDQVCSAVHEAHLQGIIHRDLKPDNIWLEPNQRGGYTVKVLDFGIAKLEDNVFSDNGETEQPSSIEDRSQGQQTVSNLADRTAIHDSVSPTMISEVNTLVQLVPELPAAPSDLDEKATAIIVDSTAHGDSDLDLQDSVSTKLISSASGSGSADANGKDTEDENASKATNALTRVGAVLGTPLYMSPEQCRGQKLDARSDVYSLGVIAYQMLSGRTPFEGEFMSVMDAHRETPPPPLKARKVRKKLKRVIMSALSKDPSQRPQSAEAFASVLAARSEGIGSLLRRSVMIYTEHLPKFLGLTIFLYFPFILASLGAAAFGIYHVVIGTEADSPDRTVGVVIFSILTTLTAFFCGYMAVGTITWLVNQILAVPLRPVKIRPALRATSQRWKRLAGTGFLQSLAIFVGIALCLFPGIAAAIFLSLVAPVVMMEGLKGFAAFKRSIALVRRSFLTTFAAVALLFFVPALLGGATGAIVALTVDKASDVNQKIKAAKKSNEPNNAPASSQSEAESPAETSDVNINIGPNSADVSVGDEKDRTSGMLRILRESLTTILMLPIQIFLTSLSAIIFALLYRKTRQAGGEKLNDLLIQFEESEPTRKKWQERVRERLIQSGRISSSTR